MNSSCDLRFGICDVEARLKLRASRGRIVSNHTSQITHHKSPHGFTLIELLTVIGIIALLLAALFPTINAITRSGQTETGVNTINVAVATARAYATNLKRGDLDPTVPGATFDGVAIIFTPNGEIRFVENSQAASSTGGSFLEPARNGYADIEAPPVDYVKLPPGTGVVGISRGGAFPGTLYLFAPPFAIRFTRQGGLVAAADPSTEASRMVYYDANYDSGQSGGGYRISSGTGYNRGSPYGGGTYTPDKWDPTSPSYAGAAYSAANNTGVHPGTGKHTLPFEELETVIGVIVFNKNDLRRAGHNLQSAGTTATTVKVNDNAANWILANGKTLLFSRLTGGIMRE